MALDHFVGLSLAGIGNPLFHYRIVADGLDENDFTTIFFIAEHHIDGSITPFRLSGRGSCSTFLKGCTDLHETGTVEVGLEDEANNLGFIGNDSKLTAFIIGVAIATPTV